MVEPPPHELVGLVPAGGSARRLPPLPCSKEIYPVGFAQDKEGAVRPRAAVDPLLEAMREGGARRAFLILREGKWDIPAYLGDGKQAGLSLAYLMMDRPHGVPFTLDQAFPFVARSIILFGFPDILFRPRDAFARLLARREASEADLVLGLFPAERPEKVDMVEFDADGRIRRIEIKPQRTELDYTWLLAVWAPSFTRFMHDHVGAFGRRGPPGGEIHVGDVIQAALDEGRWKIEAFPFPEGDYLDIGTPEDLQRSGLYPFKEKVDI